jgi:hypothetical protein
MLRAMIPSKRIRDSEWLVVDARGFATEDEARAFAANLKAAASVASIGTRLGINTGLDLATSGVGRAVADRAREEFGVVLRPNVHGVDVFPDDPNVRIAIVEGKGVVSHGPQPFLDDITRLFDVATNASALTRDVILLLNFALMRAEPVAQIVFAISAVEMLGQMEQWTAAQKQLLSDLAATAEKSKELSEEESQEVADAIRRGAHKVSLRQGVLRLLKQLGLVHLKNDWERIYAGRSTLVHGLAPMPGADYRSLAFDTISVCGQILLTFIAREVPGADRNIDRFYKVQP